MSNILKANPLILANSERLKREQSEMEFAGKWQAKNYNKAKEIVTSLSICGYIGTENPHIAYGSFQSTTVPNEFLWVKSWFSRLKEEPDYWSFNILVDEKTWRIVQAIKKIYTIKEYTTITEMCSIGRSTMDHLYLIRIKR